MPGSSRPAPFALDARPPPRDTNPMSRNTAHIVATTLVAAGCAGGQGAPPDADQREPTDAVVVPIALSDLSFTADQRVGPGPVDAAAAPDIVTTDASGLTMDRLLVPMADAALAADAAPVIPVVPDAGACAPRLPAGWPAVFAPWAHNPAMVPTSTAPLQGSDNVYAPDLHAYDGGYVMWYGGQGGDGHDRIYLASSRDAAEWRKWPSDDNPQPVLDRGGSNHVNDPSVVQVGKEWRMYYTDAPDAENDRVWLATSPSLTAFSKVGEVLGPGPPGTWDAEKVGRPSILVEDGVYRLWYDGTANGVRSVGLATSADGVHFDRHPANPLFLNAGAVDVKRIGSDYVMLREAGDGTYWATSRDGICWTDRGRLFGMSGSDYDRFGQVTPFLWLDGDAVRGVWFGGASVPTWNRNRIAVAYPAGDAGAPAGGGCAACLEPGRTCASACGLEGSVCGAPGSPDPGTCCACNAGGCEACLVGAPDCHAACVANGAAGGWCTHPGSADTSQCCTCLD